MKKSLKKFIWEEMANKGWISDSELSKFCGGEPNFYTASQYSREYTKLNSAKSAFKDWEDDPKTVIHKSIRKYLIQREEGNQWTVIPKVYYNFLKKKGVKCI